MALFNRIMLSMALVVSAAPGGVAAKNPVLQGADPHALFIGRELWIFPTGGPGKPWGPARLGAWSSTDMQHWRSRGEVINRNMIKWFYADGAKRHYLWAPSVVRANQKWYLYYSIGPQNPTPSRIGVAVAQKPNGPYKDVGKPLLTGGNGFEAIDPMVFIDPRSGTPYFYAGGSAGARLRVFELAANMIAIKREIKVPQPPNFTEGAFMHERNGLYYLSYSHGSWKNATYSVHYATAPKPIGPWKYRGVILSSDQRHQGPGHHSFVRDPQDGQWYIVYHRRDFDAAKGTVSAIRKIAIEPVSYNADGTINPVTMTD